MTFSLIFLGNGGVTFSLKFISYCIIIKIKIYVPILTDKVTIKT